MLVLFYAEMACCQYLRLSSAVTQDMSQKRQPVDDDVIVIDSDEEIIPETPDETQVPETQVPETQQYAVGGAAAGAAAGNKTQKPKPGRRLVYDEDGIYEFAADSAGGAAGGAAATLGEFNGFKTKAELERYASQYPEGNTPFPPAMKYEIEYNGHRYTVEEFDYYIDQLTSEKIQAEEKATADAIARDAAIAADAKGMVCLLNEQRRWHLQIKTRGSRTLLWHLSVCGHAKPRELVYLVVFEYYCNTGVRFHNSVNKRQGA
jgi:hypothetical protein